MLNLWESSDETFTDIARFGEKKLDLLRRFRPYHDGTRAHDHLGNIFATLDAQAFQRCFVALGRAAPARRRTPSSRSKRCRPSPRASAS
jgi:hypothetical protein